MKRTIGIILAAAMLLCLCACGGQAAEEGPAVTAAEEAPAAAAPVTAPPAGAASAQPSSGEGTYDAGPEAGPEPSEEPAAAETAPGLVSGTFVGSDGSILTVGPDGTAAYETTLTGTVNGLRTEGRVTFHGTLEDGVFTFVSVTYYGLDVTEIGRANGYSDYSYWEQAAALIYAGGIHS